MNYYVYILLDSTKPGLYQYGDMIFDHEPFYVGKGKNNRIKETLYDKESPFKINKVKKVIKNGGVVLSEKIYENLENHEALNLEKNIIALIGRRDLNLGPLCNLTDGGDGRINSITTDETKRKISETKKSQNLSIPHKEETKVLLSKLNKGEKNPMFGRKHSDEIIEVNSIRISGINHPMYGKKHDEETIAKIKDSRNKGIKQEKLNEIAKLNNRKVILQYSLSNEFISEYSSIKEASQKTGLSESLIGKTCRGLVKNPRKFLFKFKNSEDKVLKNSFEVKIGDIFTFNCSNYCLIRRTNKSIIAQKDDEIITIRKKEHPYLWDKRII